MLEPDLKELRKRFVSNSQKWHPDFHTGLSPEQQSQILQKSSENTVAYKTLKNRDTRIKHILNIYNVWHEGDSVDLPPHFLMEMMELNEFVASQEGNTQELRAKIDEMDEGNYEQIQYLKKVNLDSASHDDLEHIKSYFFKYRYLLRILQNLDGQETL